MRLSSDTPLHWDATRIYSTTHSSLRSKIISWDPWRRLHPLHPNHGHWPRHWSILHYMRTSQSPRDRISRWCLITANQNRSMREREQRKRCTKEIVTKTHIFLSCRVLNASNKLWSDRTGLVVWTFITFSTNFLYIKYVVVLFKFPTRCWKLYLVHYCYYARMVSPYSDTKSVPNVLMYKENTFGSLSSTFSILEFDAM